MSRVAGRATASPVKLPPTVFRVFNGPSPSCVRALQTDPQPHERLFERNLSDGRSMSRRSVTTNSESTGAIEPATS